MDIKNTTAPCLCCYTSLSVKKFLKSVKISLGYKQDRALSSSFTIMVMSLWRNMYMNTHYMNQCFVQITRPRYFSRIDISL